MKKLSLLIFLIILTSPLYAYKNIPAPFKVGETMEFEVRVFNITAAIQKVWVKEIVEVNGVSCYHIIADIETIPIISRIYHLHDVSHEYIDVNTLYPVKIETKIKEGNWTNTVNININQKEKVLRYVDKRTDKEIKYEGNVVGLISLLYLARTMVPTKNEKITFVLSNQDKVEYIDAVVDDTANQLYVKAFKKKFKCFLYNQIGGRNVGLWISQDPYRLPVRMISVKIQFKGHPITNIEGWLTKHTP